MKSDLQKLPGITEFLSLYKSENTKYSYAGDIRDFFSFTHWKSPEEIKKLEVIQYLNFLKNKEISDRSICRKMISVRQYFSFLVSIEAIQKNPFIGHEMKLPKFIVDSTNRQFLSDESVKKIVSYLNEKIKNEEGSYHIMIRAALYLMLYNGLRRHEVAGLNYGDIFTINDTKVIRILGKGQKERTRPIHPEAYRAVIEYLKKTDRLEGNKEDPLFIFSKHAFRGNPKIKKIPIVEVRLTGGKIYQMIQMVARGAGIKGHVSPHAFRAKFASMALEAGVPITSVQYDLGHSSVETTSIYDRAKSSLDRSSVHKIQKF